MKHDVPWRQKEGSTVRFRQASATCRTGWVDFIYPRMDGVADGKIVRGEEVGERQWNRNGPDIAEYGDGGKRTDLPPYQDHEEFWGIIQPCMLWMPPMTHGPWREGYLCLVPLQMRVRIELFHIANPPDRTSLGRLNPIYWELQGGI